MDDVRRAPNSSTLMDTALPALAPSRAAVVTVRRAVTSKQESEMGKKKRQRKPITARSAKALPKKSLAKKKHHLNKKDELRVGTKQDRVLSLLRRPEGVTLAVIMKATGWQQHSVRGFLAGVVRKKLDLALQSAKSDDERFYRIVPAKVGKTKASSQAADQPA
jgi:Protein of unknown function (DUF3489)